MNMEHSHEKGDSMQSLESWLNDKACIMEKSGFVEERRKLEESKHENVPIQSDTKKDCDEDDDLSFVVLSKSSLDSIKASSLASYVDIQQKAMSIDYNSMISSLNSNEIHQKLTELLQENGKLKETLKQNNLAMKQQFSTLATWHEEIMKVHKNHKEKFAETRQLINYLKQQNAELKQKLDNNSIDSTGTEYKMISSADMKNETESVGTISSNELHEKVPSLNKELNSFKMDLGELLNDLKKSQNFGFCDYLASQTVNVDNPNMSGSTKELNKSYDCAFSQSLPSTSKQFTNKSCEKCSRKDKNIKSLSEVVSLLEYKLKHAAALIQFCIKNSTPSERHMYSIQKFNKDLSEIFAAEIEQFPTLPHYLNNFITETIKDAGVNKSDSETCNIHTECSSRQYDRLIEDNSMNVQCKESAKSEKLSDVTWNLFDLSSSVDKMSKLNIGKDVDSESLQQLIEKRSMEGRESLKAEKKSLEQQRASLEQEKKFIDAQKKSIEAEYKTISDTRQLLQQERISLNEEKTSLDRQSQLYEDNEKAIQKEKKLCELKCDQLSNEKKALQDELEKKDFSLKILEKQIEQFKEDKNLLETQLKIYEEDFEQERKVKCTLLDEKNKLGTDLQKQFEYNRQLQNEIARLRGQHTSEASNQSNGSNGPSLTPPEMENLLCPKCETRFRRVDLLESHVQMCLGLL